MNKSWQPLLLAGLIVVGLIVASLSLVFSPTRPQVGVLLSPTISGLYYQTSSGLEGYTQTGKFSYVADDVITFYLGTSSSKYSIGTVTAQPYLTLAHLAASPTRSNNLLRLLVALKQAQHQHAHIELAPNALAERQFQRNLTQVDWHALNFSFPMVSLPTIAQASKFIDPATDGANEVVLQPLDIKLRDTFIKLRNENGELCFYDLTKRDQPGYFGPLGGVTYQISADGIYEYPDLGDYFGSWDGTVASCELNSTQQVTEQSFLPMTSFAGYQGVVGCANQGCTQQDLTGFSIDDYLDGDRRKYRTVALSFDATTQLLTKKMQGLGEHKESTTPNLAETLVFTSALQNERRIDFNGIWLERTYRGDGSSASRCLRFDHQRVDAAAVEDDSSCSNEKAHYVTQVSDEFIDMWWLTQQSATASIAQLNTPIRWLSKSKQPHYTTWEYLPAGKDWQSGTLYRLSQQLTLNDKGIQQVNTIHIAEYKKQLDQP